MTQRVRVRKVNADGTAEVLHIRESACSGDCHKCSGCGAAKESLVFTAANPIGAKTGDLVEVSSETGPVLAAATVLYMLPLVLFFVGYVIGMGFGMGALMGCLFFVAGIVAAVVYDRRVAQKKKTVYTITGFVK